MVGLIFHLIKNIKPFFSFAVLIGDTEQSMRDKILSQYKHTDNKYGKNIRVLLVSSVAAEGFSYT